MASVTIRLLGGFEASLASGRSLSLAGRKTQALLAVLALPPGKPRTRDKLTALLWSDRGEPQARSSFRQSLSELRKALSDLEAPGLISDRDTVRLAPEAVEVDAVTFERLVDRGTPGGLADAAALYRGDLLDGFDVRDAAFEDWLRLERERLRDKAREGLGQLLDGQSGEQAVATARRLLALDPLNEATHRTLMRLYAEDGDRSLAIQQYKACREVLQAELGIEPEATTQDLAEEIRRGEAGTTQSTAETTAERHAGKMPGASSAPRSLTGKPAIVVLPFVNLSGDAEQDYFADGMTEDVITELSRFHSLFVIARNSSFYYKDRPVKIENIAWDLGVRYVVQGSVRRAGKRVRVTAQLIEAETGSHLWAERYDRDLEDIFAVQDELTRTIVLTVIGRLDAAGRQRAGRLGDEGAQAYDSLLRAKALINKFTKQDNRKAIQLLERAIALDPTSAQAYAMLSMGHLMDWVGYWIEDRAEAMAKAHECAQRALELDDADSRANWTLGEVLLFQYQYDKAHQRLEKAVSLNPNDVEARGILGYYLASVGETERALAEFEQALRLDPFDLSWLPWLRAIVYYDARRYDEAIADLERIDGPYIEIRYYLMASYAQAGRVEEARAMVEPFLKFAEEDMAVFLGRTLDAWEGYLRSNNDHRGEANILHLLEGLRKAGFPE